MYEMLEWVSAAEGSFGCELVSHVAHPPWFKYLSVKNKTQLSLHSFKLRYSMGKKRFNDKDNYRMLGSVKAGRPATS